VRRVRYQVACSLDGYIAGPGGESDWITMDPEIDFRSLFKQFDALLMGRRTFETLAAQGQAGGMPGMSTFVFSTTLRPSDHPQVTIVRDHPERTVADLKGKPGKDIWLFGGGALFRSFLESGLVDTVEPAVIPVLLGGGIPFLPATAPRTQLQLVGHRLYPKSGIVLLEYAVQRPNHPEATRRAASPPDRPVPPAGRAGSSPTP
jgi:dihydrofolate reductase